MAAAYQAQFGKDIAVDSDLGNAGEQFIRDLFGHDLILVSNSDDLNKAVGDKTASAPPVAFGTYSDRPHNEEEARALQVANEHRQDVVKGTSVPGRVDIGGRLTIQ